MIHNTNTTIICPCNDGESRLIIEIAKKLSFDVRISAQGWGAVLSREPDETFADLKRHVIVVEMPDVLKEKELQEKGHNLFVLDHHQYPHLKRLYPVSALEQFACLISYTLNRWQMGVALNDRGYIPALRKQGYSEDEMLEIRQYDLEAQGYKPEYFETLRRDYLKGCNRGQDLYVVETNCEKTSYVSDLHFFENEKRILCMDLVVFTVDAENTMQKINFYGSPARARALQKRFGGYSGGDEKVSLFWGTEITTPMTREAFLRFLSPGL
ncbi:MAG: hypothetical protein DCC43_14940 [Candidatus Brocadia sp.]|jgi:hypothetical protein|uniref:DHHA1 domain-containing protein n=1 Tax=Candidatus Brocadia fulgida TaxID=380242 RepID=A0A0M2USN9_9BACT|nr:MAG: hypothetical protein BROFUL_02408 [Candidatus Brocadia fulgida]MCC6324056.1 hypothetical protein [Candidatus Brocadia sp.]MCE7911468.1 hypothetical protein [Candidatus Brocadia sp. AMX3]MBV6518656.1 hypothetical protein [Candidatus Brocadia fulgida]MDG5996428.1 hypothetical protein [Candidatus Brocadia sp.]